MMDVYSRPDFFDFGEVLHRLLNAYLQTVAQLSKHYVEGIGVEKDLKKALSWLEKGKRFAVNATKRQSVPPMDDAIADLRRQMQEEKENR